MTIEDEQKAVEDDFLKSWDWIEPYFEEWAVRWPPIKPICGLITEFRQKGYDRKFRAGQSMDRFSVSRSLRYGLEQGQHSIWFEINSLSNHMQVKYLGASDFRSEFEVERVEITPEIEALLTRLLAQPIN